MLARRLTESLRRPLRYERYEYEGPDSKLILAGFVGDQDSVNGSATEAPDLDEEHRAELERNICGVSLLHLRDVCSFFAPGFGNITLAAGLGLESDHAVYAKRLQVAYLAKDGVAEQDQLAIKNLGVQEPPPPPRCHKDDLEISFKLLGYVCGRVAGPAKYLTPQSGSGKARRHVGYMVVLSR